MGKLKDSIEEPYFFKITTGNLDGKSVLLHAKIGTQYLMYRKHKNVGREIVNLTKLLWFLFSLWLCTRGLSLYTYIAYVTSVSYTHLTLPTKA